MRVDSERHTGLTAGKIGERGIPSRTGVGVSSSTTNFMDDTERRTFRAQQVPAAEGHSDRIAVTFWLADGRRQQGHTPHLCGTTVFIESTYAVPVGMELTIKLTESPHDAIGWGTVEGVVVWHCPFPDNFKKRPGFGVLLRSHWLQGSAPELQEPKGLA